MAVTIQFLLMLSSLLWSNVNADSLALYPRESETREVLTLNGVWNFRLNNYSLPEEFGFTDRWFTKHLDQIDNNYERMPVPSSFNDITEFREIRDFIGWVWYDRTFYVPRRLNGKALLLRFGSVNYAAVVYFNGHHVMNHTGGHLPFQVDVTKYVKLGKENHISVAVSNMLSYATLPPGSHKPANDSRVENKYFLETISEFDFFNYAGIQRSVTLYAVPQTRIIDISLNTTIDSDNTGVINYNVSTNFESNDFILKVTVRDKKGNLVANQKGCLNNSVKIPQAKLWWPFTMDTEPGYQYRVVFALYKDNELVDQFHQRVGIRTIYFEQNKFLINNKPFYFRGFGKHEEYNIRGRAYDPVMIAKDFNLIKWLGANSFRTSHYPYSEELMDEADEQGIVVIDETPATSLNLDKNTLPFFNETLKQHCQYIREMIDRDKNRPSVIAWSLANEPNATNPKSKIHFKEVISLARSLDQIRPITSAITNDSNGNIVDLLDIIMLNRYNAWYGDTGYVELIKGQLVPSVDYYSKFNKLIMISEYGAETIPGYHSEPTKAFGEDYQVELINEFHRGFDILRTKSNFIGELIWNFADFATAQSVTRVHGENHKGILTRERQPKTSARVIRCRYWTLASVFNNPHQKGVSYCPRVIY